MSLKTETVPVQPSRVQNWFKFDARAYTMIGALIAIWVLFSLLHERFLSPTNLSNLFLQMSVTAILAIGMVLVIVAGHIDLSVGSLVGLVGGVAAMLNVWYDWPAIPVVIAAVALGAIVGFIQGWIIAYKAVPAFIVTLGGMLIFRGVLFGTTGSVTVAPLSPGLKAIGQHYTSDIIGWIFGIAGLLLAAVLLLRKRSSRIRYGFDVEPLAVSLLRMVVTGALILGFVAVMNSYKGIPVPFVMVVVLALIFTFITRNTTFGRQVYAIGGNPEAAKLSGINIKRRVLLVFVLCNTLAAIAALVLTARLNAATMSAGQNYELDAIAACVIGGTSLIGGSGTIMGAIIGALVMGSLDNGMSLMNMESFWQYIVKGGILVLAVYVDIYTRNRKKA
ncbi:sugar ABC transporter permease [Paenibacillus radicis (ex Gao et al. 2016)]|uniref:Xylose transport system permease protein XylH n=2 Tax=Bacillota TaxID=1239 RepID=A0A917HVQ5_9BACL|nr:sugar ABC transporter permease [Paenibacillus radicis (ex Gao et al. 2016)]GGG91041.1 xylose ABC transporter permease [Paenibacillus radicis (ex Gao et al. 2016)]